MRAYKKRTGAILIAVFSLCMSMFATTIVAEDEEAGRDPLFVMDSVGNKIYSQGPVNFTVGDIVRAVGITTKETVESVLTESDREYNYMATLDIYKCYASAEVLQSMNDFAISQGMENRAFFDAYVIRRNEHGNVVDYCSLLNNEVQIVIGVPDEIDTTLYNTYVIRNHNGVNTVLTDLDSDPKTITFNTNQFGAFVVASAPKGATQPAQTVQTAPQVGTDSQEHVTNGDLVLDSVPKTGER